jgi:PAS domain S-box-containing protein
VILIPIVVLYQLQVAFRLEESYGHPFHFAAEISFYSLVGPLITWLTLVWVERRLVEKEALEQRVRESADQLASLTAASPDAMLSLDDQGKILSWNQGAERLFEYSAGEIIGRPITDLLPDSSAWSQKARENGTLQNIETTAIPQHGPPVRVDLTQTRLRATSASRPVSLLIMRDVTVRTERAAILEEERGRIARDLHDGLAQTLYFLALKADMAAGQVSQEPHSAVENLGEISVQARAAIRDVRRVIFGLKPLDWSQPGFLPTLEQFVRDFCQEVKLAPELAIRVSAGTIPPRLEPTIFRLVQESLNNIAKHAGAESLAIAMTTDPGENRLTLSIRDDGNGFDPIRKKPGLGIGQMRTRVEKLGGRLTVRSPGAGGTEICAEIPLRLPGANHV